jgi:hypothetical protein
MGIRASRETPAGSGTRSFRFENVPDRAGDRQQYEEGRAFEEGRFHHGSIAQRVFARLSLVKDSNSRLAEMPREHVDPAKGDAA